MKPVVIAAAAVLVCLNLVSFLLMGNDKKRAKRNERRIPEKTLFLSAALFGALGGTLGMFVFRHKTKHWYFRLFFPVMLFVQAGIIGYLYTLL